MRVLASSAARLCQLSSCVAVGDDLYGLPFVLAGDPSTWTAAQAHEIALGSGFGAGGLLWSVACPSSSSCIAVGDDENGQPLVLAGDPASWGTAQAYEIALGPTFGPGGVLYSVTCTSSSSCAAVGRDYKGEPLVAAS